MPDQLTKAKIKNNETGEEIECWYNPKEISVDKTIAWAKHPSEAEVPTMEYTAGEGKALGVELLFDTYETKGNVHKLFVLKLEKLTKAVNNKDKKRPPMVTFLWGSEFPAFKGVIDSMNVKYTMFLEDGTPCRATVALKMKQADKVQAKGEANPRAAATAANADDARPGGTP